MKSSYDQTRVERFVSLSFELMAAKGIDPFSGQTIKNLLPSIVPDSTIIVRHHQRAEGDYTYELIGLAAMQAQVAGAIGNKRLEARFMEVKVELEAAPLLVIPAEIISCVLVL